MTDRYCPECYSNDVGGHEDEAVSAAGFMVCGVCGFCGMDDDYLSRDDLPDDLEF